VAEKIAPAALLRIFRILNAALAVISLCLLVGSVAMERPGAWLVFGVFAASAFALSVSMTVLLEESESRHNPTSG
jgi:uncharacterized membrane protein YesL